MSIISVVSQTPYVPPAGSAVEQDANATAAVAVVIASPTLSFQSAALDPATATALIVQQGSTRISESIGIDLSGQDLRQVDLSKLDLRQANLKGADLSGKDLSGLDFSGADLTGANLSSAILTKTNLSSVKADKANCRIDLKRWNPDLRSMF